MPTQWQLPPKANIYLNKRRQAGLVWLVHNQKLEVFELDEGRSPRLGVDQSSLVVSSHLCSLSVYTRGFVQSEEREEGNVLKNLITGEGSHRGRWELFCMYNVIFGGHVQQYKPECEQFDYISVNSIEQFIHSSNTIPYYVYQL